MNRILKLNEVLQYLPEEKKQYEDAQYPVWPVPELADALGVMYPQLDVLVALPGNGKTTFGIWLSHQLADMGYTTRYGAAEPSASDVAKAILAQRAGVHRAHMRDWTMEYEELRQIIDAVRGPWVDRYNISVAQSVDEILRDVGALAKSDNPLRVAVLDYAQYYDTRPGEALTDAMDRLAVGLSRHAKSGVMVIALAQLNYAAIGKKRMSIHDIHWAKRLTKEAHMAAVLQLSEDPSIGSILAIDVQKARNGRLPSEPILLGFDGLTGQFFPGKYTTVDVDLENLL